MGRRGPKADVAQAAKGFPGRRRTKAVKAVEEAARIARLLAPTDGKVDMPPVLADAKYAPAAVVWTRLAPELRRTHRLPKESEIQFVQFCIYAQEWFQATDDLHTTGFTQQVATVAGGKMERRRPKTFDRQQAYSNMMELSVKFGLTPLAMYDLFKGQAAVAATNPGLFPEDKHQPTVTQPEDTEARRVGGMARHRSKPPGPPLN